MKIGVGLLGSGIRKRLKRTMQFQGNLAQKITYYRFARLSEKKGVVDFRIDRIASEYTHDYYEYPNVEKEDKKWAYSKGFASYKMVLYGLNRDNYKDYISDFVFYNKNNYVNREFESWFEHKLNTYYLLMPFADSMPKHYWYIRKPNIMPIAINEKRNGTLKDIIDLIKDRPIAAKAVRGGHAAGFYKLEYKNDRFIVNNEEKSEAEFTSLISKLNNYIITDYVKPSSAFETLVGDTFVVMRVITVYDENDGPQITSASIRLGCKAAGVVADYDGTIYCGINLKEGTTFRPLYRENDYYCSPITTHPDTGQVLEGWHIPHWDKMAELAKKISGYIPMTPYLVMDVIPAEAGFSILEINTHGQPRMLEPFYPFMANPYNRKVFHYSEV